MTTIPDWLAVLGLVIPAGTGLAGYVLAGRNELARDDRAARREAMARRASVRERLETERHAFQRETLLELQSALQRQVRAIVKVTFHDRETLKEHGTLTLLSDDLSNEAYAIKTEMQRLQERVLDTGLRGALSAFRDHVATAEGAFMTVKEMSPEDGIKRLDRLQSDLAEHFLTVSDQIGGALRSELGWLPEEAPPLRV